MSKVRPRHVVGTLAIVVLAVGGSLWVHSVFPLVAVGTSLALSALLAAVQRRDEKRFPARDDPLDRRDS
ncbi:hypothetical protein [Tersicoccus sp. Bi-70]|uniref:hypothetical protein n=1 Tax=Tersicoccus sp. Bi-70 TaxID=1897634 RepID=UPI0009767650|nr:hypothetical protein [Tersicoccus sp. Bi-70]OMH35120.1 hypothetical protein BGP79_02040 [Tersicoccus sp. Bi-70]